MSGGRNGSADKISSVVELKYIDELLPIPSNNLWLFNCLLILFTRTLYEKSPENVNESVNCNLEFE